MMRRTDYFTAVKAKGIDDSYPTRQGVCDELLQCQSGELPA